jgi:recombinational DNA repair protein RecR
MEMLMTFETTHLTKLCMDIGRGDTMVKFAHKPRENIALNKKNNAKYWVISEVLVVEV